MGHDVSTIGNHKLDTSSIENLAKDLSVRFEANVEYGIYDDVWFDWDGFEREASHEFTFFGTIIYPGATKTLKLFDKFFQHHIVINRYGKLASRLPYFSKYKHNLVELEDAIDSVCFEIYDYDNGIDYGTIYNNIFWDFLNHFDARWWSFCRAFTVLNGVYEHKIWNEIYESTMFQYRKDIRALFMKIGGTEVVYVDDQGKSQYISETYMDWEMIVKELDDNFKDTCLNVSEFMKKKRLLPENEYPLAFYDDFADLTD